MAYAFGLSFRQETDTPTTVRDFIRTLLGPRPHVNPPFGPAGSGAKHEIELQKSALIAYRAKIVALIDVLEGGVNVPGNEPMRMKRNLSAPRKPISTARTATANQRTAA